MPQANGTEAALVEGLTVWPAASLGQVLELLADPARACLPSPVAPEPPAQDLDLADVRGQPHGRRALEIAAAGSHHLLLVGPRAAARRCWPDACLGSCHPCNGRKPWNWASSIRWRAYSAARATSPGSGPSAHPTTAAPARP